MVKNKILVLGSKGQLASQFLNSSENKSIIIKNISFENFIKDKNKFKKILYDFKPNILVNFFAFTNVEACEGNFKKALKYNSSILKNIGAYVKKLNLNVLFIHISTDFVFSGKKNKPYLESDTCQPINNYGLSKLIGDYNVQLNFKNYIIFRVGWIFSKSKNSFLYKVLKFAKKNKIIYVTDKEIGRPTSSKYIVNIIKKFISKKKYKVVENQIINISQEPTVSRYKFAKEIFKIYNSKIAKKGEKIQLIKNKKNKSILKRPKYSALSNLKIRKILSIKKSYWKDDLKSYLN